MRQKRIMILGGNAVQAEATLRARRLGYFTVSTDLHPDNPGHAIADEYRAIDIMDSDEVTRHAAQLAIDGIVPYTSDALAPVADRVAQALSLPRNPPGVVYTLTHKDAFRAFLESHGFPTPTCRSFTDMVAAQTFFTSLHGPAMLKPADGAGSRGVFRVDNVDDIAAHWSETLSYSAEQKVVIESFIERQGLQQDGDIFVIDGQIRFWGMGDQHKDPIAPFVPALLSFPSTLPHHWQQEARRTVQDILSRLGFDHGPCNVEYMIGTDGRVYVLEIGPRNGGNLIPFALQEAYGIDLTTLTLQQAVGDSVTLAARYDVRRYACSVLAHAQRAGTLVDIEVAQRYVSHIVCQYHFRRPGDHVERFHNGRDTIASYVFAFSTAEDMRTFINGINDNVRVVVE